VNHHLRAWRLARGESFRTLARKAGVHFTTIVRIEQGRVSPSLDTLGRLAQALRVHVTDLLPPKPKRPRGRRRKETRS
jgi:transcriptional regulator with XRE-family HTH domain